MPFLLAIDQGTTSSRAIVFDSTLNIIATGQREFPQHFPQSGWVEHDVDDIWTSVIDSAREAIARSGIAPQQLAGIGITNQRETVVLWDRTTGRPLHRAIVWQDRRTADRCEQLRASGHEADVQTRTGLLLDPYFSATKIGWLLDHVPGARQLAGDNRLCAGTIDSYLIWRMTGGRHHVTDVTNASRTLLCNIETAAWDKDLCSLFGVPIAILPEIRDCAGGFGAADARLFGAAVPILGVAGDQQAAAIGQGCFSPGMLKVTFGTGCFALLNTGPQRIASAHRLLTTIAYQFDGKRHYALEGAIFSAGSAVQWLRDAMHAIARFGDAEELARTADPAQDVVLVPAFTGLGAPYWRPDCRGATFGMTRATGAAELARAALESVGYQTNDLIIALAGDWNKEPLHSLKVDGGMAASDWTMQWVADIVGVPVIRPAVIETTAKGAAYLAAVGAGLADPLQLPGTDQAGRAEFVPRFEEPERYRRYHRWLSAVTATLAFHGDQS